MSNNKYNYADHIKSPTRMGVSNSGDMYASINDLNAIFPYIDTLLYGKNVISDPSVWDLYPLGNNYFIKSGTCGDKSSKECINKPRYIYVRNVPSGVIPCMGSFSPKTKMKGLVPGIIEDIADINPFAIFNDIRGKGAIINDKCITQTLPVGRTSRHSHHGTSKETRCSPPLQTPSCLPEFFIDYNKSKQDNHLTYIFIFIFFIIIIFIYKCYK